MREYHVRFCEGLGVKFPGPTRQISPLVSVARHARSWEKAEGNPLKTDTIGGMSAVEGRAEVAKAGP